MPVLRSLPYLVALALLVPALALAGGPGLLGGQGTASTFFVHGSGAQLEGGLYDWTYACALCLIRITFTQTSFVQVDGGVRELSPGAYELRGFDGVFAHHEDGPSSYAVLIAGIGKIERLG